MLKKFNMLIDGESVEAINGGWFESFDPYTGKPWALIPKANASDVEKAIESANNAFIHGEWSKMTASDRGKLLRKFADLIEKHADELAKLEVQDNGKLLAEMSAQLRYLPNFYHYFGGLADKSSVQFSRSVVSDSLRPHESQHARPPWVHPNPAPCSPLSPTF